MFNPKPSCAKVSSNMVNMARDAVPKYSNTSIFLEACGWSLVPATPREVKQEGARVQRGSCMAKSCVVLWGYSHSSLHRLKRPRRGDICCVEKASQDLGQAKRNRRLHEQQKPFGASSIIVPNAHMHSPTPNTKKIFRTLTGSEPLVPFPLSQQQISCGQVA